MLTSLVGVMYNIKDFQVTVDLSDEGGEGGGEGVAGEEEEEEVEAGGEAEEASGCC
jgi:hypothetical protein